MKKLVLSLGIIITSASIFADNYLKYYVINTCNVSVGYSILDANGNTLASGSLLPEAGNVYTGLKEAFSGAQDNIRYIHLSVNGKDYYDHSNATRNSRVLSTHDHFYTYTDPGRINQFPEDVWSEKITPLKVFYIPGQTNNASVEWSKGSSPMMYIYAMTTSQDGNYTIC